jgi:predicted flap endonuclease-1-like 5' DNA nuclease
MTNVQVPMNEAQIELLKLFATGLQEHQMKALKQMLISFQFRLLEEEVEKAAQEKNITDADVEKALDEHWRTPYVRKPQQNLLIVLDSNSNSAITSLTPNQYATQLLTKDDLKIIEGISPKIEALLFHNGIFTFAQLSQMKIEALQELLKNAGKRYMLHDPTHWIAQAALATAGKWEDLKLFQNNLNHKPII